MSNYVDRALNSRNNGKSRRGSNLIVSWISIEQGTDEHITVKNGLSQHLSAIPANAQSLIGRIEHLKLFVVQTHVYQTFRLGAYPEYIPAFFSTIVHNIF